MTCIAMQHRDTVVSGCVCPNLQNIFRSRFQDHHSGVDNGMAGMGNPSIIWGRTDSYKYFVTSGALLEFVLKII